MSDTDLIRATLLAAAALHERRMWRRFTNLDCFGVRLPDRDELLLACVMGEGGEQHGLMLCRGPEAVAHFDALTNADTAHHDAFDAADVMGFSMDRFGDLFPEAQAVFREAGLHPRSGDRVPGFIVKPPHRRSRLPDADEWSLLRRVLAGVLRADEQQLIEPIDFDDPKGVCVLTMTGDADDPAVTVDREVMWHDDDIESFVPPVLRNTDGEDLLFHTASFHMADRKAVKKTLKNRKGVDYDHNADEYVWSSETGEAARMMGGPVTLARMEMIDDELIVTTNSAERFERVRAWLTEIPGVRFMDVQTRDPDALDTAAPLVDQLLDEEPFEPTPEMRRDIEAHITNHYMNWLDTPLPALKGRTPREACRDEQGRAEVTTLIRNMPDPAGNVPVAVPREAMLRELGLPVSAVHGRATGSNLIEHHATEPKAEARTKVGRNDPCPCGSGKKYKKCCG